MHALLSCCKCGAAVTETALPAEPKPFTLELFTEKNLAEPCTQLSEENPIELE